MQSRYIFELSCKLSGLSIFRSLLENEVIMNLREVMSLAKWACPTEDGISVYSEFVSNLYKHTDNLSEYIFELVINDDNVFVKKCAAGEKPSENYYDALNYELDVLQEIMNLTPEKLSVVVAEYSEEYMMSGDIILQLPCYNGFLPKWRNSNISLKKEYTERILNINKYGYGIYAKYYMFIIKNEKIVPVKHPDRQTLADLVGYNNERKLVIDNTKALLAGKPAANVLLYGDAGTGKSSTVKAVVNEYKGEGLRVVEVRKEQLWELPAILDELSSIPLKFIIFIDDLSFQKGDDNFGTLKAILEGSVSARSGNVVIYATSNRRHLVKESFSDRDGDDVHRNDTMQETISLSERFGLKVAFGKPDKKCYVEIVKALLTKHGIKMEDAEVEIQAERFALLKGGRSARGARQFVDSLLSKEECGN
ncbi:MAG: ATP-binding protein [Clostridiales bacterium]|nr:ATP-binding protein [Clostridiales bacterium]